MVCRDGLAQMKASLEKGTQQEVPNTTGHYGKTIAVTPPPDWDSDVRSAERLSPDAREGTCEYARELVRNLVR